MAEMAAIDEKVEEILALNERLCLPPDVQHDVIPSAAAGLVVCAKVLDRFS